MKYYFLASYLPEIQRDNIKIRVTLGDLLQERFHIPKSDWKEIELVLLGRDMLILERLLSGKTVSIVYACSFTASALPSLSRTCLPWSRQPVSTVSIR